MSTFYEPGTVLGLGEFKTKSPDLIELSGWWRKVMRKKHNR